MSLYKQASMPHRSRLLLFYDVFEIQKCSVHSHGIYYDPPTLPSGHTRMLVIQKRSEVVSNHNVIISINIFFKFYNYW